MENSTTEFRFATHTSPLKAANRMDSPGANGDGLIAAFKPSRIPSPPSTANDQCSTPVDRTMKNKDMFSSPVPTPGTCQRETTLKMMEAQIEAKLANERDLQACLKKRLEAASPDGSELKSLEAEASLRQNRITDLDRKLAKARHTLGSLQTAQTHYHESARKVEFAENQLNRTSSAGKNTKRGKLSKVEVTSIRSELQQATAAMSLAARRVEQMESITDLLIEQLSEREAELQEVKERRSREAAAHETQVQRLSAERDTLIDKLHTFKTRAAEIEEQDAAIRKQLNAASKRADNLEIVIEAADKAYTADKHKLEEERANLTAALKDLSAQQEKLHEELLDKEAALAAALQKAQQGTPKGNGAKVVLPMALQRIKETQGMLKEEAERREAALNEALRVQQEAEAQKIELADKIASLESERERQVAEKQASLEMMTRAAAMATKEAAIKQEALQKATSEVASLTEEREGLLQELEGTAQRCLKLETSLSEVEGRLTAVAGEKQQADAEIAVLKNKLEEATKERNSLQATLKKTDVALKKQQASATKLEEELTKLKDQMAKDAASTKAAADKSAKAMAKLESRLSDSKAALVKAEDEKQQVEERLAAQEASVAELMSASVRDKSVIKNMDAEVAKSRADAEEIKKQMTIAVGDLHTKLEAASHTETGLRLELAIANERCQASQQAVVDLQTTINNLHASRHEDELKFAAQKAESEGVIERLTRQLSAAMNAQESLKAQVESAKNTLADKVADVEAMESLLTQRELETANLQAQMERLKLQNIQTTAALQQEVASAREEMATMERERDRLHGNLMNLAEELEVRKGQIDAAKAQGTPKGESAKIVLKASFEKIKLLQAAAAEADAALNAKAAAIASRDSTIAQLRATDKSRAQDIERMSFALAEASVELEQKQAQLENARKEVEALKEANAALEPQAAALAFQSERAAALEEAVEQMREALQQVAAELEEVRAEEEARVRSLEAAASEQMAAAQADLNAVVSEKEGIVKELVAARERLDGLQIELAEAKSRGTPQGAAAKQVVKLSFEKIRGLQLDLETQHSMIKDLETKLDAVEDNASQLATELGGKSDNLRFLQSQVASLKAERDSLAGELVIAKDAAEAASAAEETLRGEMAAMLEALEEADHLADRTMKLEKDNADLESAMCRLRLDVQAELEARKIAESDRAAAKEEAEKLSVRVDELTSEVTSLKESLEHLGEVVATADRRLKGAQENAKGAERQWSVQLTNARRERDDAEAERLAAETRVRELEKQLAAAVDQYDTIKSQGTPLRNAAKRETAEALERADAAEKSLQQKEASAREAEARATKLSWELRSAQSQLERLTEEAQKRGAAEKKLESAKTSIAELHAKCAEHAAGQKKASEQTQAMESALAAAREEAAQLAKLRENSVEEAAAAVASLQVRITDLENQLTVSESIKESSAAALLQAQAELEAARELADVRERLDEAELKMDRFKARAFEAVEERDEFAAKNTTLALELSRKERELMETTALLRQVSEALALQRETTSAAQELAEAKETENLKSLEAANAKIAKLTSEAAKVPILERAQMELCAQLREIEAERRAASARARDAESQNNLRSMPLTSFDPEEELHLIARKKVRVRADVLALALGAITVVLAGLSVNGGHGGASK